MNIIKQLYIKGGAFARASLLFAFSALTFGYANAETVLLEENFDKDYSANFSMYDGDGLMPARNIQAFFLSNVTGTYMPWWHLKETAGATDRFIGSHAYYTPASTSNDWLISKPITIPTNGFVLEFDAQSVVLRGANYVSDLAVYITQEQPGPDFHPTSGAAVVYEKVPTGPTLDVTTDEWTHYTLSLDQWAGQTVHISFVNQNHDKDLLCIDNVKVSRAETAELVLDSADEYISGENCVLNFTVKAVTGNLTNWKVVAENPNATRSFNGDILEAGSETSLSAELPINPLQTAEYTITLTADGIYPIVLKGSVTRLGFPTTRRVLLEETTGLWCANCPRGMYNIEAIHEDPELSEFVVPVSIHITGGTYDMMAMDDYAENLGIAHNAPIVRINRQPEVAGFSTLDNNYDPEKAGTFANRVMLETKRPAIFDIDVTGEWIVNAAGDTTAVKMRANVRPALNIDEPDRYRVGFILTENNVGLDNNPFWVQENGVSGYPIESKLGGWTELPSLVVSMRYHFVARAITQFGGIHNSFNELKSGNEYTVETTLDIPDTYSESPLYGISSHAVRTEFCEVTAYIVDTVDKTIANCARYRMSENEYKLFTAADLVKILGVEDITAGNGNISDPAIYDLHGRKVSSDGNHNNLAPGIYIHNHSKLIIK